MSQEEKNARNLRLREARQKKKEFQNPMETNSSRAPLGNLTNHTNGGAESVPDSQSAMLWTHSLGRSISARRSKRRPQRISKSLFSFVLVWLFCQGCFS